MESYSIEQLSKRYIELRELNKKTHLCGYFFRQRCLKDKDRCQFAHGITDIKKVPSHALLTIRQELFNLKQKMKNLQFAVLYNWKTKKHEVYRTRDLNALKKSLQNEGIIDEDQEEEEFEDQIEEGNENKPDQNSNGKYRLKRSIQNLNLEEYHQIEEIQTHYQLHKFDMNKVVDSEDEENKVKRMPRTKEQLAIIRPWQNEIMSKYLLHLFNEAGDTILFKSTVLKKFNEAGVPLTWTRLCLQKVQYEKKVSFPPFPLNKKITIVLPLLDKEQNLKIIENLITQIMIEKVSSQLEKFKLPVRLADIQKEYMQRMQVKDPPLFIVTKQCECEMDTFFYKILESRGYIRNNLISHLKENYQDIEWANKIINDLEKEEVFLFMPFSHEALIARELIEKEFVESITLNVIVEEGKLNGYLMPKYFSAIKNNDEFEKITYELLIKHGYKILKIGTGNYIMNQFKHKEDQALFNYEKQSCPLCNEPLPDVTILGEMIEQACEVYGQLDSLQYFEDQRILLVNNYKSMKLSFEEMSNSTSLGVDLEGRLSIGGNINLIQIAADQTIFIFDIYYLQKISKDENLLELVKQVLKYVFLRDDIRKVFFDCKKDIEALHYILRIGIRNVQDAQPIHMTFTQLREFQKNRKLIELKNAVTPGLNDVLSKHEVSHGINSLKNKFKKIFNDGKLVQKLFATRPLDPEFISYSAQDVEDLSELVDLLAAKIDTVLEIDNNSTRYRDLLIQQVSHSYASRACLKYEEVFGQQLQQ